MKLTIKFIGLVVLAIGVFIAGATSQTFFNWLDISDQSFAEILQSNLAPDKPLQKYAITQLSQLTTTTSPITLTQDVSDSTTTAYLFEYQTSYGKVSGRLTVPSEETTVGTIVMLRGFVPANIFQPGVGTQNAANYYTNQGYITIAPDFLGYGSSDPELENSWQNRFIKPVLIKELIDSINDQDTVTYQTESISLPDVSGLWGHSNGGQIALTTLLAYQLQLPTTLWAPVTAPFPYSVLFFSDDLADEGRSSRLFVNQLDQEYDTRDFSLTQHLARLVAPIQIHHGTADDAALVTWSRKFADKIATENARRANENVESIEFDLYEYTGADHNLRPGWETVVERDVTFWREKTNWELRT